MAEIDQKTDAHSVTTEETGNARNEDTGQVQSPSRRGFLTRTGLATVAAMVGTSIPFSKNLPIGFVPAARAGENVLAGKDGLTLLNDRPINAETPPHLLDDAITPTSRHFVRIKTAFRPRM